MYVITDQTPRASAAVEIIIVVAIALFSRWVLLQYFWRYAGPVSLVAMLALLTVYLGRRGETWRDYGLVSLKSAKSKWLLFPQIALTFAAFVAAILLTAKLGVALGFEFMGERPSGVEDRWGAIEGNLPMLLLWLGIVWTAAAFGEEMFFRGYLITRLQTVFAGIRFGSALSVLIPALIFGFGHVYYQGLKGFIVTGAIAVAFGTVFLLFKRNLWPTIFLHGAIDSLGMIIIYLGAGGVDANISL